MRRRLQQLKDDADGGSGMLASNISLIDGRDAKPADILGPAMAMPFLAPARLVIVEHLLERYEATDQRPPRKVEAWDGLFDGLAAGLPETTILVFNGVGVTKRNAFLDRLRKLPNVLDEEYPELKGEALSRYIRDEAAARGIRFRNGPSRRGHAGNEEWENAGLGDRNGPPTDPVELLKILLQGDTLGIANELDKLALYTMGREVTVDEIYEVSAGAREFDSFAFTDAVMDGNLQLALRVLGRLRADGMDDAGLLAFLFGAYRRLAPVVELAARGATTEEMAAAMGNAGKFQRLRDNGIRRARALGIDGLRQAYELLVEADRTAKTGEVKDDLAFEIAIMRLCALVTARVPAGRR
jgi:DNA polymerase-3 subunit delta